MSIIEKYFIEEIEELSEKEIKDAITKKLEKYKIYLRDFIEKSSILFFFML